MYGDKNYGINQLYNSSKAGGIMEFLRYATVYFTPQLYYSYNLINYEITLITFLLRNPLINI